MWRIELPDIEAWCSKVWSDKEEEKEKVLTWEQDFDYMVGVVARANSGVQKCDCGRLFREKEPEANCLGRLL